MPGPQAVPELQAALAELTSRAGAAATKFAAGLRRLSPSEAFSFAADAYPKVLDPFVKASGELTAQWYAEQPTKPQARGAKVFVPEPAPLPPPEKLAASARWAVAQRDTEGALRGNATRLVMNGSRDTMISNAAREGVPWVRVSSSVASACGYCKMAVARSSLEGGELWTPDQMAVVDRFHDHCNCSAVAVRDGVYAEPAYVAQWREQHRAAVAEHGGDTAAVVRALTDQRVLNAAVIAAGGAAVVSAVPDVVRAVRAWRSVRNAAGNVASAAGGAVSDAAGLVLSGPGGVPSGAPPADPQADGGLTSLPMQTEESVGLTRVELAERDSGLVNPKWTRADADSDSGDNYAYNCVRCVVAYELRRRGYDVEARPSQGRNGMLLTDLAQMWQRGNGPGRPARPWDTVPSTFGHKDSADSYLKDNYDDGARGFIVIEIAQEEGGGGHVFSWELIGDEVVYLDPQRPAFDVKYTKFKGEDNFERCRAGSDMMVVRVDDLVPRDSAAEVVTVPGVRFDPPTVEWMNENFPRPASLEWTPERVGQWWRQGGANTRESEQWIRKQRAQSASSSSGGDVGKGATDNETLVLYHGTTTKNVDSIKESGLRPPERVNSASWPMLTDSLEQAREYVNGRPGAVVLEYHVPKSAVYSRGNSSAMLWPGVEHPVYDQTATAYAIKTPLPADLLRQVLVADADAATEVTLPYIRNNNGVRINAAPDAFNQNVEPWGRYVSHDTADMPLQPGWERGTVTFSNPLNVDDTNGDWKQQVSDQFGGATGKELSQRLLEAGYDGVLPRDKYGITEIVDVRPKDERGHQVTDNGDGLVLGAGKRTSTKGGGPGSTPVSGKFGKVASRLPAGTEIKPVYALNKDGTVKLSKSGKPQVDVAGTWAAVSDDTLDENLRLALRQAQPWAVEAGTTWYPGVRKMATRLTKQYAASFKQQHGVDLSPDLLGGLVSVFSRNNGWIRNIVGVRQYLDDPFAEKPKKDKKTGVTKMVKPMHVTMTGGAENLIAFVKARHEAGLFDDHVNVEAFFAQYPTAPKPHRFWRSIMGDEDNSAIDRWMARVQLHTDDPEFAEKMRSATKTVNGVKDNYGYHRLEASIKRISREPEFAGYTATQLQAMPWVHLVGPDGVLGDIQDLSSDKAASAEARRHTESMGWRD
jgi:hypothetical protein